MCSSSSRRAAVLTGLAVSLVRSAVAAVAEEVALELRRDAALVTAGELGLPTRPRSSGRHLCFGTRGFGSIRLLSVFENSEMCTNGD